MATTDLTLAQVRTLNRLDGAKNPLKMTGEMRSLCFLGLATKVVVTKMSGRGGFPSVDRQVRCLITDQGCQVVRNMKPMADAGFFAADSRNED